MEELARALSSPRANARRNAWICLTALVEAGATHLTSVPEQVLVKSLPDAGAAFEMMTASAEPASDWLTDVMANTVPLIDPTDLKRAAYGNYHINYRRRIGGRKRFAKSNWLNAVLELVSVMAIGEKFKTLRIFDTEDNRVVGEASLVRIGTTTFRHLHAIVDLPSDCHSGWELTKKAVAFESSPTKHRLAAVLRAASTVPEATMLALPSVTTWPLKECILAGRWDVGWPALAEAVESGLLGDRADWERWENSWVEEGLKFADACSDISSVIDAGVASPWFPLRSGNVQFRGRLADMPSFMKQLFNGRDSQVRGMLATDILRIFRYTLHGQSVEELPPALVEALLEIARSQFWQSLDEIMSRAKWLPPVDELWVSAFAEGALESASVGRLSAGGPIAPWLLAAFRTYPEYYGILVAIAHFDNVDFGNDDIYRISRFCLDDEPTVVRLSRAVILLRAGRSLADVRADVHAVFSNVHANPEPLFQVLSSEDVSDARQIDDLLVVHHLAVGTAAHEALALSALRTSLRRRQSDLIDERRWVDLGFMRSLRDVMRPPEETR